MTLTFLMHNSNKYIVRKQEPLWTSICDVNPQVSPDENPPSWNRVETASEWCFWMITLNQRGHNLRKYIVRLEQICIKFELFTYIAFTCWLETQLFFFRCECLTEFSPRQLESSFTPRLAVHTSSLKHKTTSQSLIFFLRCLTMICFLICSYVWTCARRRCWGDMTKFSHYFSNNSTQLS